jgi:cell division protease FtsH
VNEGYEKAKKVLEENRETLCRIAETLLEKEVLDANEVHMIINNIPLEEKPSTVTASQSETPEDTKKQVVQSLSPSRPSLVDKQREKPAPA